jgi:hypothetical protein
VACGEDGSAAGQGQPIWSCVPAEAGLQLYTTESLLPPDLNKICVDLTVAREPGSDPELRASLVRRMSRAFAFQKSELQGIGNKALERFAFKNGAGTIGAANDAGYVTLQVDQVTVSSDPAKQGLRALCGPARSIPPDCQQGFLCQQWNCANFGDRAQLNARLHDAFMALKTTTATTGTMSALYYLNPFFQAGNQGGEWQTLKVIPDSVRLPPNDSTAPFTFALGASQLRSLGPKVADLLPLGPSGSPHPFVTGIVGPGVIYAESNKPSVLAIRTFSTPFPGATSFDRFWGGLSMNTSSDTGYFMQVLLAESGTGVGYFRPTFGIPAVFTQGIQTGSASYNCSSPDADHGLCGAQNVGNWFAGTQANNYPSLPLNAARMKIESNGTNASSAGCSYCDIKVPYERIGGKVTLASARSGTSANVSPQSLLDGAELLCRAVAERGAAAQAVIEDCDDLKPPVATTVGSFEQMGKFLQCVGDQITRRATTAVYSVPPEARDRLLNGGRQYEARGGELAVAVSELRNSLLEAGLSGPVIGSTIFRFGQDLRSLKIQLQIFDVQQEIEGLQLDAQIAQQATSALGGLFDVFNDPRKLASAITSAANSIAQIGFAIKITNLKQDVLKLEGQKAIADFSARAIEYTTTLEAQSLRLSQALEGIQRQLEHIESLQIETSRRVDTALWYLSAQAGNEGQISNVLRNLKEGKRIRYQTAFSAAQRMADLAKRAIEQRLGMKLADISEDLPLVPAPATWESSVCSTTGIDYQALRESGRGENFADGFIGDYVTKLEQVVESYRLQHNFHEGSDTAVVSLRDDVHNVRAECEVESRNQLLSASDFFSAVFATEESRPGWVIAGCLTEPIEVGTGQFFDAPMPNCLSTVTTDSRPFFDPSLGQRPIHGYTLHFGGEGCTSTTCGWQPSVALAQTVTLEPGRHRLSWYTREGFGEGGATAAVVRTADGTPIPPVAEACPSSGCLHSGFICSNGLRGDVNDPDCDDDPGAGEDWNRVFFDFDLPQDVETVSVGFEHTTAPAQITIAAPMLEKLADPGLLTTLPEPPPFSDTGDTRTSRLAVCEDTDGAVFRAQKWERHCLKLCPDGYQSDCRDSARLECFWETTFHVSQRGIEAGHLFNQSGFARGNFNYRIESLGLNFVGTDLRQCADASLPSTCNSGAFVPYSLEHAGPYYVRNHQGEDFEAKLFTGRIEHARGLGAERYLTNPLGSADRELITPYLRTELNGRPLDGEFVLRVWDEPGMSFQAIDDVQLVLNYRYWTRFN